MKIYIKTLSKGVIKVIVNPGTIILEVKALIEEGAGIMAEKQHIVYHTPTQDIELDDDCNLEFYGIQNRACINLYETNAKRRHSNPTP